MQPKDKMPPFKHWWSCSIGY